MRMTLVIEGEVLELQAACFGARGSGRKRPGGWTIDLEGGVGTGVFLLGDEDEDAAFLGRIEDDATWRVVFRDLDARQVALQSTATGLELLLKLEDAGAPIVAEGDPATLEVAVGPALWVTVTHG
jgi:hypothetical protein